MRLGNTRQLDAEGLTARETQVLELLAEGLSNKGIGTRLDISDQTVKFHSPPSSANSARRTEPKPFDWRCAAG